MSMLLAFRWVVEFLELVIPDSALLFESGNVDDLGSKVVEFLGNKAKIIRMGKQARVRIE